jgi:hypothetical protein
VLLLLLWALERSLLIRRHTERPNLLARLLLLLLLPLMLSPAASSEFAAAAAALAAMGPSEGCWGSSRVCGCRQQVKLLVRALKGPD